MKKKTIPGESFFVKDGDKPVKEFPKFDDVVKFFDSYSQPEIDKHKS
jgi:hypothetical protein